jgi:uncharacterized membrane protein YdfJ with MMPL/SSD domain
MPSVIISLLGLYVIGLSFVRGLATGAALGVLTMMIAAVTLLPALIGLMARRLGLEVIGPALFFLALVLAGLHLSLTAIGSKPDRELIHD